MKKIILFSVINVFIFNCLHAQISKGSTLLGGDVSFGFGKTMIDSVSTNQNSISFTPMFAKAVKDNLFVGGYIGVAFSKDDLVSYPTKGNSYSIGMLIRKYKPIKNGFFIFGQGNLGGSYTKYKYGQTDILYPNSQTTTSISISVSPGISYALTNKFHIEAGFNNLISLNYFSTKREFASVDLPLSINKQNGILLNTSLNNMSSQLFMGFRLLLQKNKNRVDKLQILK